VTISGSGGYLTFSQTFSSGLTAGSIGYLSFVMYVGGAQFAFQDIQMGVDSAFTTVTTTGATNVSSLVNSTPSTKVYLGPSAALYLVDSVFSARITYTALLNYPTVSISFRLYVAGPNGLNNMILSSSIGDVFPKGSVQPVLMLDSLVNGVFNRDRAL